MVRISLETENKPDLLENETGTILNCVIIVNYLAFEVQFELLTSWWVIFHLFKDLTLKNDAKSLWYSGGFFFVCVCVNWSHFPPFPGSMFSALVLVFGCLLQRKAVTTEGHHGSNRHIFYVVQMDGGVRGARVRAQQHGLEFIQRVSAFSSPLWAFTSSRSNQLTRGSVY